MHVEALCPFLRIFIELITRRGTKRKRKKSLCLLNTLQYDITTCWLELMDRHQKDAKQEKYGQGAQQGIEKLKVDRPLEYLILIRT